MSLICEKYNPTLMTSGKLMTKKIVPGKYFWSVLPLVVVPIALAVLIRWEMIFFMITSLFLIGFMFMILDIGLSKKYCSREWRPFNRRRTEQKFFSYGMLEGQNAGENYRVKLIEYLDALRAGGSTDSNVEQYLNRLHKAERLKIEAMDELRQKNSSLKHLIDESLIDRMKMEKEAAEELL